MAIVVVDPVPTAYIFVAAPFFVTVRRIMCDGHEYRSMIALWSNSLPNMIKAAAQEESKKSAVVCVVCVAKLRAAEGLTIRRDSLT